ncbi:MAG: hypothetical protein ABSA75_05345 [Candidatus Bathyarchaeia archaeon]|jgi:hypothetical protein
MVKFIGKLKATNGQSKQVQANDTYICDCFEGLLKTNNPEACFKIVKLAIGKISDAISFAETLDRIPKDVVPKSSFDALLIEKEHFEKTAKFLAQCRGIPELNSLINSSRTIGLLIDEIGL